MNQTTKIIKPKLGLLELANQLRQEGIMVSGSGVRSIWLRHDLESFKKCLIALETKVTQEGCVLTENQLPPQKKQRPHSLTILYNKLTKKVDGYSSSSYNF